jgi:hypothetical protein
VFSFRNIKSLSRSDSFVATLLPGIGLPNPFFHRAMWATTVALACGVIGVVAVLCAVLTGHELDHASSRAAVDPGLAELWYDFAALQAAGIPGGASQARFVPAPEPEIATPPAASRPNKRCTRATWPFFDNDCLWGNTVDSGTRERRRKKIVTRLKSPWCSGLHLNDGAYFCRPRS